MGLKRRHLFHHTRKTIFAETLGPLCRLLSACQQGQLETCHSAKRKACQKAQSSTQCDNISSHSVGERRFAVPTAHSPQISMTQQMVSRPKHKDRHERPCLYRSCASQAAITDSWCPCSCSAIGYRLVTIPIVSRSSTMPASVLCTTAIALLTASNCPCVTAAVSLRP